MNITKNHYSQFESIWTHRYINIYDNISQESFNAIIDKIMVFLDDFQNKYSRFLDNSLVNILAKNWNLDNPPKELLEMIELSQKAEYISEWYFSILVANILIVLWYGQKFDTEDTKSENTTNIYNQIPSIESVLQRNTQKISIKSWFRIDLWWIGKWRAIDHISGIIKSYWIISFMVNWWWDIYVTWSNIDNSLTLSEEESLVYFQDPLQMDKAIWYATTNTWWFASSSTYHRNRYKSNKKYHHLIDPKSWTSSNSPLLWIYIYHPKNTVIADVASTVLYICPPDRLDKIAKKFWVEYLLILPEYQTIMSPWFPGKLFTK